MKALKISKKILVTILALCFVLSLFQHSTIRIKTFAAKKNNDDQRIVVSLGDSYSSGEGVEPFYCQDVVFRDRIYEDDWLAHRSEKSWPGKLKLSENGLQMKDRKDSGLWYFKAASGAETQHINGYQSKKVYRMDMNAYRSASLAPQINILKELRNDGKHVDYVTLTIGGNDAHFGDIVSDAANIFCSALYPGAVNDKLQEVWNEFYNETDDNGTNKPSIRDRIRQAYYDIREQVDDDTVIIVAGYPKLFKSGETIHLPSKLSVIRKEEVDLINDSVSRFNKEIKSIVDSCKADGMRICFVSVEEEFDGHEAYADDSYLNGIEFYHSILVGQFRMLDHFQELDVSKLIPASEYSMHPNEKGTEAYAKCVQEKIDSIEKDNGKSEWPEMSGSKERDIVLVLDKSGSMDGEPIKQTVAASEKFIKTILKEDASIGIVAYDNNSIRISSFKKNETALINSVKSLNAGGSTNMEAGLKVAQEMLSKSEAKKKIIVMMSDGEPNKGKVGDYLTDYANEIKDQGIYIYTLGFFQAITDSAQKESAQAVLRSLATDDTYHYEVDSADDLVFFFNDIADQINGQKYIYIRIECPVDVTVKYKGEKLSSSGEDKSVRTSFGTLTFEENTEKDEDVNNNSKDNRVKILRLKDIDGYDISIKGNGKGHMDYTIGFMDDNGEYSDMRKFNNIKINKRTKIDTVAENTNVTTLNVDSDGDGEYDLIYEAEANGRGKIVEKSYTLYIVVSVLLLLGVLAIVTAGILKKRNQKAV